jgi:hypothetical protein
MSLILDRIGLKTGPETIIDTISLTRERGRMVSKRFGVTRLTVI